MSTKEVVIVVLVAAVASSLNQVSVAFVTRIPVLVRVARPMRVPQLRERSITSKMRLKMGPSRNGVAGLSLRSCVNKAATLDRWTSLNKGIALEMRADQRIWSRLRR